MTDDPISREEIAAVIDELKRDGSELSGRAARIVDRLQRGWVECGDTVERFLSVIEELDEEGLIVMRDRFRDMRGYEG